MTTAPTTPSVYPGFNTLLMGPSGTGKTYSISTLCNTALGLEVFYLATEPGLETLLGVWADKGLPIPQNLHWHYMQPKAAGFSSLLNAADLVGKFNLKQLSDLSDPDRGKNNRFYDFIGILNNFTCQRTGAKFGSVDSWGTNRVLVIDGLTEVNQMALSMVVGTKPVRSQSDWGIAQNNLMMLLRMLTAGCNCHLVLIAHVERETDLVLGGVKLMVSTLGKAITGQIPAMFSDVILSVREGTKFYWDTASSMADVKTRNLPMEGKLEPDFAQIVNTWKKRASAAAPT